MLRSPFVYKKSREQLMLDSVFGLVTVFLEIENIFVLEYLEFYFKSYFSNFFSSKVLIKRVSTIKNEAVSLF